MKDAVWEMGREDEFGVYAELTLAAGSQSVTQRFRRIKESSTHAGFWLADTACTQEMWEAENNLNRSCFLGEQLPVENVSWFESRDFLNRLSEKLYGMQARLPTEKEWEYSCRAGTTTPFSFGEQITPKEVNYNGTYPYDGGEKGLYRRKTVAVKSLPANPWGLYEMHGNVHEWCAIELGDKADDWNPKALRGGSWASFGQNVLSRSRAVCEPGRYASTIGFRILICQKLVE